MASVNNSTAVLLSLDVESRNTEADVANAINVVVRPILIGFGTLGKDYVQVTAHAGHA